MIYNEQLKKRSGKQLISPIKDANITDLESFTRYERVPTTIFYDMVDAAKIVAKEIATIIKVKELMGENCVIGLVTGVTPVMVYHELVRMHKEENLSFKNVVTFNTYEFCTFEAGLPQHCMQYLNDHLFNHVDIKRENIFFIDGSVPREKTKEICQSYELEIERQGGIDLLLLGIGRMGHISFNEPGSSRNSTTRLVTLSRSILYESNQYTDSQNMPRKAITIGIATIMKAKKILLLAVGDEKTTVVKEAIEGRVNDSIPASFLQEHPKVKFVLDEAAASDLTRIKTPWLIDACEWDDRLIRKGVIWLCQKLNKPILKLTDKDYNDNGMNDLITLMESAYKINIKVFNDLQHTITGWPGGKPNADDTNRPERALPFPKKIFIFSPHPDDDVISMGGTFLRLVEQGHDVHVAYHVSGSIAVADDETLRFSSFVTNFKQIFNIDNEVVDELYRKVEAFINTKKSGQIDIHEVREIKALIRRGEALAACRFVGISEENVHFLNMPFYETGKSKKSSLSDVDIQIIVDLLQKHQPDQIFAAGDLADPHGTHKVCLDAIFAAFDKLKDQDWMSQCRVWLYRGAWQEWEIDQVDMAVPISPDELMRKRKAIFKHQSQKDGALFQGNDLREFWQRAEDRNRETAKLYDALGMAEYEAIEAFVQYVP